MESALPFQVLPLRFVFLARESIHFPEGSAANTFRGAFGTIFRRIACVPECAGAADNSGCKRRDTCPYTLMFSPSAKLPGPSGLVDLPRPFVFRAMHLDGLTIEAGQVFHFDLNLFDMKSQTMAFLVQAFSQLAEEGLGTGRRKVELTQVLLRDENGRASPVNKAVPLRLKLEGVREPVPHLTIRFVTPTELKTGQQLAARPEFGILAARARDRVSTLSELYGSGTLQIDFKGFGERAGRVRMVRCETKDVAAERRSSRTGQVHWIGGFIGEAEYEGEIAEFLGVLRAARWTGVGRQTVWGKGEIECR